MGRRFSATEALPAEVLPAEAFLADVLPADVSLVESVTKLSLRDHVLRKQHIRRLCLPPQASAIRAGLPVDPDIDADIDPECVRAALRPAQGQARDALIKACRTLKISPAITNAR